MSWQDYSLARQLLVEERIGTRLREAQHLEDEKFRQSTNAIRSTGAKRGVG
jgi:hypothetical protein